MKRAFQYRKHISLQKDIGQRRNEVYMRISKRLKTEIKSQTQRKEIPTGV